MPFAFEPASDDLPDVILVTPRAFGDERGWFMETFKRSDFAAHGIAGPFVQDDHSRSQERWVLRGLHFQIAPAAQGKLVRCTEGEIFDVAVDLRPGTSTYRRCACVTLSAREPRLVWIPPGFAHGFLTLSDGAEVQYKHTHEYSPEHARRVRWDDPQLAIPWPLDGRRPLTSRPDAAAPLLAEIGSDLG